MMHEPSCMCKITATCSTTWFEFCGRQSKKGWAGSVIAPGIWGQCRMCVRCMLHSINHTHGHHVNASMCMAHMSPYVCTFVCHTSHLWDATPALLRWWGHILSSGHFPSLVLVHREMGLCSHWKQIHCVQSCCNKDTANDQETCRSSLGMTTFWCPRPTNMAYVCPIIICEPQ